MNKLGKAPKCPRCTKAVYFAEQKVVFEQPWHRLCFTCKECKKSLSSNFRDHSEGGGVREVYCPTCYNKHFAPKGYGFGVGAGILNTEGPNGSKKTGAVKEVKKAKSEIKPYREKKNKPVKPGPKKFCSQCGEQAFKFGQKFCMECGTKL
ncbi:hypothetical protein AAMO2058_001676600 [Amorphochlora amoebiformis]